MSVVWLHQPDSSCQSGFWWCTDQYINIIVISVLFRLIEVDLMWRMDSPTARPITATLHRPGDSATDLTNQSHPSTWMDGHEWPTGSWCRCGTVAQVVRDEQKEDSKDIQILPRLLHSLQGQDKRKGTISQKSFTVRFSWPVDQNKMRQELHLPLPLTSVPTPSRTQFHHFVEHV